MSSDADTVSSPPRWSFAGCMLGVRLSLPLIPGIVAFAIAIGTTAARKGFTLADSILMNGLVYAGASQMVALEIWPDRITVAALAGLALLTATVNARMLLMGAALRPWLAPLPSWQVYPTLHLLTDPGWLIAMRYRSEGGSDIGILLGGGIFVWIVWVAATTGGYLVGAVVANPRAWGLDLVMPIFFGIMLIPLWQGRRRGLAWIVAGVVAVAVQRLLPGWWFIIAGAVAGSLVEAWSDEHD
jgi:predicted branched-subunit amino acid permease